MKAIVAMSSNRAIGKDNKIPWKLSEDLKWFKEFTMGKVVLMGRKTYESLKTTFLPGRSLMVLTKTKIPSHLCTEEMEISPHTGYYVKTGRLSRQWYIQDVQEILDANLCKREDIIVAGGKSIYEQFLSEITEFYVTYVIDEYEGDTFMPEFEHLFPNSEIVKEHRDFWVVKYWK